MTLCLGRGTGQRGGFISRPGFASSSSPAMASPPLKFSKLSHDMSHKTPTLANSASKLSLQQSETPPPRASGKKRLGLSSGLDKNGSKKLTLKSKREYPSLYPCAVPADRGFVGGAARSTPPQSDLVSTALTTLTRAVRAIQSRPPQPTPESLQSLYTLCEALVASGPTTCQTLYDRIRMEIERQAGEIRRVLVSSSVNDSETMETGREERWLTEFEKEGRQFLNQMLLVRSIVLQLDRTYVLQSPALLSIWYVKSDGCGSASLKLIDSRIDRDLGLDIFHHSVLGDEQVSGRVTSSLLSLIEMERYINSP